MKKFLSVILILFMLSAAACDSSVRRITVATLITGEVFELKIKFDKAITGGDHIYFTTGLTLAEIKTAVDNTRLRGATVSSEILGSDFLLIDYTVNGKQDYFIIAAIDGAEAPKSMYYISAPSAYFSEIAGGASILVPLHLFAYGRDATTIQDTTRELTGSKQDFVDFYSKIDQFEVSEEDDRINIKVNAEEITGRHIRADFCILFSTEDGKTYAEYSPA